MTNCKIRLIVIIVYLYLIESAVVNETLDGVKIGVGRPAIKEAIDGLRAFAN